MSIRKTCRQSLQAGISLVELVMFIVVVSVGIAGILSVMDVTTKHSADPLLRKQALAIAESVLEEIQLMPFTFCDPDDANAEVATSAAGCADPTLDQNKGGGALITPTPTTETRDGATTPFDNVADYGGFAMSAGAIKDITGESIASLGNYTVQAVNIERVAFGTIPADGSALLITVTVTGPTGESVTVQGVRTRYAPRAVP